jgi:plastocyanin
MWVQGEAVLIFRDGVWTLRDVHDGLLLTGAFALGAAKLAFHSDPACQGEGSYRWSRSQDQLMLDLNSDDCSPRTQLLVGLPWSLVPKVADATKGSIFVLGDGMSDALYWSSLDATSKKSINIVASSARGLTFFFSPTVISGSPGETIHVRVSNDDPKKWEHNFTLESQGISFDLAFGESHAASITLPTSGDAIFYCSFHVHTPTQSGEFTVS